jgi:plastocyanin
MRMKIIALFLILASILFAGCVGDEEPAVPEATPTETATEEATETPTEVETPTEMATETEEATPAPEPKTWTIRLENFLSRPSVLEINKGDTVVWMNFNSPTRQFTLVSKDGLWEDVVIGYRLTFAHTFNETGTYNYTVLGFDPRMSGSVIVK